MYLSRKEIARLCEEVLPYLLRSCHRRFSVGCQGYMVCIVGVVEMLRFGNGLDEWFRRNDGESKTNGFPGFLLLDGVGSEISGRKPNCRADGGYLYLKASPIIVGSLY
jgi:hypothetical protein